MCGKEEMSEWGMWCAVDAEIGRTGGSGTPSARPSSERILTMERRRLKMRKMRRSRRRTMGRSAAA
jgi:hypothetical protein